ncbi:MAG: hypothetical protein LPK26_05815 [Bacillaceae bacterium]|nr:hypothetical protein [Bacillaceae bacterium]
MQKNYPVPLSFRVFPFYVEETKFSSISPEEASTVLFNDDMLEALGEPNRNPWLESNTYVPELFVQWKETRDKLSELYSKRDPTAVKPLMVRMVAQLIQAIYWTNHVPVTTLEQLEHHINQLDYKPINISERLSFILTDPAHFHSYNQLKALFEETEKMYYRTKTKMN